MSETNATVATRAITVQGLIFNVASPYVPGHICTAEESGTLNQTRGENIRNNMADTVKKAQDKAKAENRALSESELAELTAAVAKYDAEYTFNGGTRGPHGPKDPVKDMAYSMILARVRSVAKDKGQTMTKKEEGEWQNKIFAAKQEHWRGEAEKEMARLARSAKQTTSLEDFLQ